MPPPSSTGSMTDHSDSVETWAFLDRRIADVMRVAPGARPHRASLVDHLPNPFRLFRAVRR